MRALWIVAGVLLILFLLSLIRVGGMVDYAAGGLTVRLLAGPLHMTVFPFPKRKKERPKKEKKEKPDQAPGPDEKAPGGSLDLIKEFLPLVTDAAGSLRRKIRVDRLEMDLTVGAPDPAMAAIAFGGANAALGMLVPLLENAFQIKERRLRTAVDFNAKVPVVAIRAALTLTIGQGAAFALHFGIRALGILLAHRKRREAKSA